MSWRLTLCNISSHLLYMPLPIHMVELHCIWKNMNKHHSKNSKKSSIYFYRIIPGNSFIVSKSNINKLCLWSMFKHHFYLKDDNLRSFSMMALTAVTTSLASAAMVLGLVCLCLPRYAGGRFPLAGSPFLY